MAPENPERPKAPSATESRNVSGAEPRILEQVSFEVETSKDGKITKYKNSTPGRKRIVLSEQSPKPIEGQTYDVRIIEDTKPEDANSGQYIVELIEGQRRQLEEGEWREVEENVQKAENPHRQALNASAEIFKRTGIPKSERTSEVKETENRIVRSARFLEEDFEESAKAILGAKDTPEGELVALRRENVVAALRTSAELKAQHKQILADESDILRSETGALSAAALDVLRVLREGLNVNEKEQKELFQQNPEAYYGLHLKELKDYKRESEAGRIVETPYVKKNAEDIYAHLRGSKPVLIFGHLGTGKTELAMHVAREYVGKEALVVSGSKDMSLAELYGHQVLKLDSMSEDVLHDFTVQVEDMFKEWTEKNLDATEQEKDRVHDTILQTYLTRFQKGTVSDFFMGPIYRAMEEGRPVIIDEVNAIPHELLISLNYIATRRPGDEVTVQQDSGRTVTVQEGFGLIMTANLNQGQNVYVDRQEMDPAFLSRLYKLEHDYLPQVTEGGPGEDGGGKSELYHILLAKVMDRHGNIQIPEGSKGKLWNLAQAARITQDIFAGREVKSNYYFQIPGSRAVQYFLKESVLSMRAIESILTQWQAEGYKYELDYYIWNEFVGQSTQASDRAFLYQIFKDRFGFFTSPGWEQNPDYGTQGTIRTFTINPPRNQSSAIEFTGPREVVDKAYGTGPERTRWPDQPTPPSRLRRK